MSQISLLALGAELLDVRVKELLLKQRVRDTHVLEHAEPASGREGALQERTPQSLTACRFPDVGRARGLGVCVNTVTGLQW